MKKFILITKSESYDPYHYFIQSEDNPTAEQIEKFLQEHAHDKDKDEVYEYVEELIEIKEENFISI